MTYRNLINGELCGTASGRSLPNVNPANFHEVLGYVPQSTAGELEDAVAAAKAAYPSWKHTPAPKRGDLLLKAVAAFDKRKEAIARVLAQEEGKTYREALGEVQKGINVLEFQAGQGRRISGYARESELVRNFAYTKKEPLGVVGLITPWNFPFAIPVWKMGPALVSGNTVVWKPSELTAATAQHIAEVFLEAGFPKGVVNVVHGLGPEVGEALARHPHVRALSFTGSNAVGQKMYRLGAERGIKVQCEMGGKNAIIVLDDADLELAAIATAQGAFGSTGQRCTATSRAIVQESIADAFVQKVLAQMEGIVAGDPLDPKTTMGPQVSEPQLQKVLQYQDVGRSEAQLVRGGGRLTAGALAHGWFSEPTLFDHVAPTARIATEEIFGPVLSVIRVKDFDEGLEVANGTEFGLSSSLYTNDYAKVFQYADRIETGICHVNSPTMGGEAHLPFGGMKSTGIGGREMNEEAIDFYTETKVIYFDYTGMKRTSNVY